MAPIVSVILNQAVKESLCTNIGKIENTSSLFVFFSMIHVLKKKNVQSKY